MWERALILTSMLALASGCAGGSSQSSIPNNAIDRPAGAATLTAWTLHDATRLRPNSAPYAGRAPIALSAARNETVSFQIAVRAPASGLTGVTLSAQPFTGGSTARKTITSVLFREYFVNIPHASPLGGRPRSLGAGTYPDGLIPFVDPSTGKTPPSSRLRAAPIGVPAGEVQPYWIDVRVAANAAPGDYSGTYVVRSDQGAATFRIPLHVWHFNMPTAPSLDSSFGVYSYAGFDDDSVAADTELLSERIQFSPVVPANEARLQPLGLKMVALGIWSGADYGHCAMVPPPSASAVKRLAARNTIGYQIDQPADEIGHCRDLLTTLVPIIQKYARELHAANVLDLITMSPIPALEDDGSGTGRSAVDIWTMQPAEYDDNVTAVRKALAKGDRAWFYTDLVPDDYSPKWAVDAPPADYRIPALIDESLGLTGELYWAVNKWHARAWDDIEYPDGGGVFSAGEGILSYPGADVGIASLVPSMRLKWIRDGMYDADEVSLLKACGRGAWALAQARSVGGDWHHWTEDTGAIEAVHFRLAKALDSSGTCGR
jgi:Domain of unknown function (DUF4091)